MMATIDKKPMPLGQMARPELENRLIDFAGLVIEISEALHNTKAGNQLSGEIARSGTLAALNYGETQDAASAEDILHRVTIVLKGLRETRVCLKIIRKARLCESSAIVETALTECDELISIFVASVNSTKKPHTHSKQPRINSDHNRRSSQHKLRRSKTANRKSQ